MSNVLNHKSNYIFYFMHTGGLYTWIYLTERNICVIFIKN